MDFLTDLIIPEFAAYAAGCIDCDGWIAMTETPSSYRILIGLKQVQPKVVYFLKNTFGGNAKPVKDGFLWMAHETGAIEFLEVILPYLRIKRSQAELAIAYRKRAKRYQCFHGTSAGIDTNELAIRHSMYLMMKELNGRAAAETKREGLDLNNQVSDSPICRDDKSAEADRNDCSPNLKVVRS